MRWSMKDPDFKLGLFRFVDVLPSLSGSGPVAKHLREYLLSPQVDFSSWLKTGMRIGLSNPLTAPLVAALVRQNVSHMASSFIAGADPDSAGTMLKKLWRQGRGFTVAILGEAVVSEEEALATQRQYIELICRLSEEARAWQPSEILERALWGVVPRVNVSVKCSALVPGLDGLAFDFYVERLQDRLRPILRAAVRCGAFVNLDMEQNDYRTLILATAEGLFCEQEFAGYPHLGIVCQAYLRESLADLKTIAQWQRRRTAPLTVRLVKGAYWDYEVAKASQRSWQIPVYTRKEDTDVNFERCLESLLCESPRLITAIGSHNVRSVACGMALAEARGIPPGGIEIQMLYGMAGSFKQALVKMGYRLREYAPVGKMLPGMAYLVRRLLENTSNQGFLAAISAGCEDSETLLAAPRGTS